MFARPSEAHPFAYVVAIVAGLFALAAPLLIASILADTHSGYTRAFFAVCTATYALLGAAFGFIWPDSSWRWGVWVSVAPATLFSFFGGGVSYFIVLLGLTLLPACAGAYAGARLHLKFTKVN
jgi:hypothetical protein